MQNSKFTFFVHVVIQVDSPKNEWHGDMEKKVIEEFNEMDAMCMELKEIHDLLMIEEEIKHLVLSTKSKLKLPKLVVMKELSTLVASVAWTYLLNDIVTPNVLQEAMLEEEN